MLAHVSFKYQVLYRRGPTPLRGRHRARETRANAAIRVAFAELAENWKMWMGTSIRVAENTLPSRIAISFLPPPGGLVA